MSNELDIHNEYYLRRFPDPQEEDVTPVSKCYACPEILYEFDEVINWNGLLCCNSLMCLLKMTEAQITILERSED